MSRRGSARQAIGEIEKDTDTFILTYGQFSLIDALLVILNQTGPAHVTISTWTAAHAHLDKTADMMAAAEMLSFRMITDRSFRTRQPLYFAQMLSLFGEDSVRQIRSHAKFMLIRNESWDIVVRTSMNLNENPRLENIEISEHRGFAEFFQKVADDVFRETGGEVSSIGDLSLKSISEHNRFKSVSAKHIDINQLQEARYSYELKEI